MTDLGMKRRWRNDSHFDPVELEAAESRNTLVLVAKMPPPQELKNISTPHDHDVLSGRGNFVNYHPGNEHFRGLVRKHKHAYVACPKPLKSKYSRMIVDSIRSRDPPGRFLKQDDATKLWYDIGEKKVRDVPKEYAPLKRQQTPCVAPVSYLCYLLLNL